MKTSVKILIAVIAVAVLGIGAAAAVILSADPYKKAETAYVTELMPFGKNVKYLDGYSGAYDIEYEIDESLADMIGTDMGAIAVWGDFDMLTSAQRISAYLTENDDTIGGEAYVDTEMVYLTLPGITDYVMTAEIENAPDLPELNTADLLKTGTAVSDIYFDMTKEYGTYGDGELVNGGETFKADTFTIDFTGYMLSGFITDSVDEIRKNDNLMDYLNAYGDLAEMDFEDELDTFVEDAQETLDEYGDDTLFTMTVYIKGGKLIGRELYNFYNDEDILIQLYDTEKGSARNQLIRADNGYEQYEYKGDFEKSGNKYSGTAKLSQISDGDEEFSMTADISGFEYYPEGGFADGDITIETEYYDTLITFDISMQKDGYIQFATITGDVSSEYLDEDINIGTITMSISVDPANPKIETPEVDDEYVIDLNDIDYDKQEAMIEDIAVYYDSFDHDGILYQMIESMMYDYSYYY